MDNTKLFSTPNLYGNRRQPTTSWVQWAWKRVLKFHFSTTRRGLSEVLTDRRLASLGDAYINFVCSLALSNIRGTPCAAKVKGRVLAEALAKSGLKEYVPPRKTRHMLADAAEALVVYGWLHNCVTLSESVLILERAEDFVEGISELLKTIMDRVKF